MNALFSSYWQMLDVHGLAILYHLFIDPHSVTVSYFFYLVKYFDWHYLNKNKSYNLSLNIGALCQLYTSLEIKDQNTGLKQYFFLKQN